MYKLLIFDLDGTLLDTSRDIRAVLNESLQYFKLPPVTIEQTLRFVGNGAKKLVERAVGERADMTEKVFARFVQNLAVCENGLTRLYEGEDEFLNKCEAQGIKLAIVTNKPEKAAQNVCKKHLSAYSFVKIAAQGDGCPLKPDPASTLKVIEEQGVKKEDCLFIGDGETDVLTAKNAGIDCVSALWGYRSRKQLTEAGAVKFARGYSELAKIIFS